MQPSDPPPASVPPRVLSKLALYIPPKELVDLYLGEIAKSYGAPFEVAQPMEKLEDEDDKGEVKGGDEGGDGPGEGQERELNKESEPSVAVATSESTKKASEEPRGVSKPDGETTSGSAGLPDLPSTTPAATAAPAPVKKVNEDDELAKRFERLKNLR